MKRLSTKLISSSKITFSLTSISGTQFTTCSSSIFKSPIQTLNPCSNSNALFYKPYKTHQLYKNPFRDYTTHVGIRLYFPSNESKNKEMVQEVVKAAKAAESAVEMFDVLKDMEDKFDEGDLGVACLNIGLELAKEGEDPQKILSFANKALALLDNDETDKCCLPVAMTLQLLGSINFSLRKFNDALGFFNRANKILIELEDDGMYEFDVRSIKIVLLAVQIDLADVEIVMGRNKEAMDYLRKSLEIKEFLMGKDSREFGDANREFAGACVRSKNFKDGLSYCLKALEIHLRLFGENSLEIAHDRQLLGVIYAGLEEYEKAVEENWLAQKVFRICGCSEDVIRAGIDAANMLIVRGRYEAAMKMLKEHEKGVEENNENPFILMTMGKALSHQENFADAKGCLEIACRVLDKMEKSKPLEVADAYIKIADQYKIMNDVETAISLLLRALALLEKLLEEQHLEGTVLTRIGCLLFLTDKAIEAMAIPYLERAAETVKERYGSKHFGVGYIYNKLGRAYLELERPESAAKMFALAKIFLDSVHKCQNLSTAMNRWGKYGCTAEIVKKFKSAIISDRYVVLPNLASLAYSRPIYNIDANFVKFAKDNTFQIGTVARSEEGDVLWAKVSVVDMDLLMPPSLAMDTADINMAEIAGFGFITIHAHEHGIKDFLVVTDNKLSRDYLSQKKKKNKKRKKITNKSHQFLVVLCKQMWFYSRMSGRRVIWVEKGKNRVADALSRTRSPCDKCMQVFDQVVKDEVPNFIERIEREKEVEGREVEKDENFEKLLEENMRKLRDEE